MKKIGMVNIGTAERPMMVPEKALRPNDPDGRAWWGKVTDGSVWPGDEALDRLLERLNEKKN